MKPPLGKLERIPLRKAWAHEAGEFTPWLAQADNLNLPAEALGLDELELVGTEHTVGDFKVDILCSDNGSKVIIENQLEKTNRTHLGQLLTYAAGVGSRKVIWVAESFRTEHVAALEFLNRHTTDELHFFAVEGPPAALRHRGWRAGRWPATVGGAGRWWCPRAQRRFRVASDGSQRRQGLMRKRSTSAGGRPGAWSGERGYRRRHAAAHSAREPQRNDREAPQAAAGLRRLLFASRVARSAGGALT